MKNLFTFILLLLFVAIVPVNAASVKSRVVDTNNDALIGVSIITNISGKGVITDNNGEFIIEDITGVTRITFSSVGYQSCQFDINSIPEKVILKTIYYRGENILVTADRAEIGITPIAFDNLSQKDIERDYTVGEFPLLLESTPNLYSYSDAGSSLGYSYTKIRGFDDKRIVTYINGVPLNDPEDHATYFVDLPDFAANVSDIQIQRGVGNSLYGDASFGGSINIVTSGFNREQQVILTAGYGEYTLDGKSVSDVYKQSLEYSSGLINGRWQFSGRFSKQKTGGFRHNSWYEGWSYYFSVARLDPKMSTELYVYGGPMRMHLAYYGSTRSDIEQDWRHNPLTYDNETDNFNQPHYHLHNIYRLNDNATLSNTLYYIRGKGYYEQYKTDEDFEDYNIDDTFIDFDTVSTEPFFSGDVVRQQWVEKNQIGWNPRLDIEYARGKHSAGGSFYYFDSDHWGQVVWAQHISGQLPPRNRYYQYNGKKYVGSFFGQEYYKITEKLSTQLTAQFRYQKYDFDQKKMGAFAGYQYNVDWLFFSPRLGFNYTLNDNINIYTNLSIASRTPSDNAIYDANDPDIVPSLEIKDSTVIAPGEVRYVFGDPTAKSETVYNLELGGQYRSRRYALGINFFWMDFKNEIIPYGGINENNGIPITVNADRSVHAGVELNTAWQLHEKFTLSGNMAYNYNRVKDYTGQVEIYLNDWSDSYRIDVDYKDKKITGFPDYLGNLLIEYDDNTILSSFRLRFVGRQYMELFNIESLAIDPYLTASWTASFTLKNFLNTGNMIVQGRIDNLFDKKYETSGYGWSYGQEDETGNPVMVHDAEYFVASGRSFYAQIKMELF